MSALVDEMLAAIRKIDAHLENGDKDHHRSVMLKIKAELHRRIDFVQSGNDQMGFEMIPYGRVIADSWEHGCQLGEDLIGLEQKWKYTSPMLVDARP